MGTATTNVLFFLVVIFVRKLEHCRGSSSTFANVSCISNERKALLKFKGSLMDHSNRLSPWIGEDCCIRKGVVCSRTSRNVVKLDLRNQFQLDELDIPYFDFYPGNYSSVYLKGHIPFGNQLQTLDDKSIYIGNNGLCGPPLKSCPGVDSTSEGHERIKYKINDEQETHWFY